ncbi:unnamed protein product [Prorocentrum cordatum]|uniref:Pentatricopeptide repeat-containing protein n=1 Tax=Prorocentrum cordatum TaxID=2364126 RepID=A0ABN9U3E5_9DINO|nr:unnamed protein product [Polarella glacialis]
MLSEMREVKLELDAISYNAGISACEKGEQWQRVLALLSEMWEAKVRPDSIYAEHAPSLWQKACGASGVVQRLRRQLWCKRRGASGGARRRGASESVVQAAWCSACAASCAASRAAAPCTEAAMDGHRAKPRHSPRSDAAAGSSSTASAHAQGE